MVEDDEDIRELLIGILRRQGYTVYGARDGREGLERLSKVPRPCLILLDLMMPVMNGFEFMDALREDDVLATIPIVVVSAYELGRNKEAYGWVAGRLKKPIDLSVLLRLAREHCGTARA